MTQQETTDARTDAVSASLANSATAIKQTAHQRWTLELTNGSPHTAEARLEDHWLCLDIPLVDLDCPSDRQLRRMLAIQAGIDGAAKFIACLTPTAKLLLCSPRTKNAVVRWC